MHKENATPTATTSAGLVMRPACAENVEPHGKYVVVAVGPIESCRSLYTALRDKIARIEKSLVQRFISWINGESVATLRAQMACIPMERKWADEIDNLVTTVGKNLLLDTILTGTTYTAASRMGLKGAGSAVVGDTQASHGAWLEVGLANAPTYTGNRQTPSFSAAAAGSKATSAAVSFAITGTGTVAGCFININGSATKDDTTGTLYSAGDFSGGSRSVINGDTLNVTYTATA